MPLPALRRSSPSAVAYAYLVASGEKAATTREQVRDLARLVKDGAASVDDIARELRLEPGTAAGARARPGP
ncbi:hypothetical protein GCM10010503_21730 [Streptomyces lucensis JCM 4490]|uniref:Uncharacterized protein n=1 Tax=Streptomyces lucensis JCM 4490 TaxID=1306176 RepID=A0A918J2K3_9ACTN|nr:hypothetical protein GCM10010503_21730 [Streptomyces lucensis JCM 4490]